MTPPRRGSAGSILLQDASWALLQICPLARADAELGHRFEDQLLQEEPTWTSEYIERVVVEYRRFLFMHVCRTNVPIVPSRQVDKAWHMSIINTPAYRALCDRFFHAYLDHQPAFSGGNVRRLRRAYGGTIRLYTQIFGHHPPDDIWPIPTTPCISGPEPDPGPHPDPRCGECA